jgi:hypothetical protein
MSRIADKHGLTNNYRPIGTGKRVVRKGRPRKYLFGAPKRKSSCKTKSTANSDCQNIKARNEVIAGDYETKLITFSGNKAVIVLGLFKNIVLDKSTIETFEVVDETSRTSAINMASYAATDGILLSPVGLPAGLSTKSKQAYTVSIQFRDGCRSLLEVDDKIYKAIITKTF